MQTVKRTIVILDEGESITIETKRGESNAAITVKADYRGDEGEGTAMLLIESPTHDMLDDDSKEIQFATVEGLKVHTNT